MPRRRRQHVLMDEGRARKRREKQSNVAEIENFLHSVNYCLNCRRTPDGASNVVVGCRIVTLTPFCVDSNMMRQKFCLIEKEIFRNYRDEDGILKAPLCKECSKYLKKESKKEDKQNMDWSIVWPSFFWQLMSSCGVRDKLGMSIWSILPREWRDWWLPEFQKVFDNIYSHATIDFPKPVIRDLTKKKASAEKLISELKLFDIEKEWDDVLACSVLCPFGCSEFVHKTKNFPIDILLARALDLSDEDMKFVTPSPAEEMHKRLRGMRDDYLTFPMKHYVAKLNNPNPEWEILPGVAFVDGEPKSQVCRNCEGGSPYHFLYPPRNPFPIIGPPNREQIAAATVQSRILKTGRASSYSDRHQMLHLQGHINGVDTIRVTTERCDISEDQMSIPFDSLALLGREDVRAYVLDLFSNASTPYHVKTGDNWLQRSEGLGDLEKFKDFYASATYITAAVALKLEMDGRTRKKPCLIEPIEGSETDTSMKHFSPVWPRIIPYVHAYNKFGCKFPALFHLKGSPIMAHEKALWITCGVISLVEPVWKSLAMNDVYDKRNINGYMLTFAAKTCFQHLSGKITRRYPFKLDGGQGWSVTSENSRKLLSNLFDTHGADCNDSGSMLDLLTKDSGNVSRRKIPDNIGDLNEVLALLENSGVDCLIGTGASGTINFSLLDARWELRLIGGLWNKKPHIFVRHGGNLEGWWKISSSSKFVTKDALPQCGMFEDDIVVVFVKPSDEELDTMRHKFLESIGGQNRVYCKDHDLPLVVNAKIDSNSSRRTEEEDHDHVDQTPRNVAKCSSDDHEHCSKTIGYCCPIASCDICLCTKHMIDGKKKSVQWEGNKYFVRGKQPSSYCSAEAATLSESEADASDSHTADDETDSLSEADASNSNTEVDETKGMGCGRSGTPIIEEESSFSPSNDSYIGDGANGTENDNTMTDQFEMQDLDLFQYNGNFDNQKVYDEEREERFVGAGFFDYEDLDNHAEGGTEEAILHREEDDSVYVQQQGCSTTASLWDPIHCVLKQSVTSVSGSVILNNCGTLLARGYRKLQANTWQNNFLQKFIATSPGKSIPLLYAEGTLFPRIFWKDDNTCGILGAIPTALLASDQTLHQYGIGGVPDHLKNRIRMGSGSICCENQDYLCYAYDSIANLSCRGEDTRLVLRRGGGTDNGSRKKEDKNLMFDSDSIESRPHVNQLCAKMKDQGATYFGSHSGNHRDHFGLKSLKAWIDSRELFDMTKEQLIHKGCVSSGQLDTDIRKAIVDASTIAMLRHWHETTELFMRYICHSTERPLGKVIDAWYRHEYQESAGNLSHLHYLLWIDRSSEKVSTTMERIRGGVLDFVTGEELQTFAADGMVVDRKNEFAIQDLAEQFLTHICSNRCMKRVGENGDLRCRVSNNGVENPHPLKHSLIEVRVEHSEAATDRMVDIGLMKRSPDGKITPVSDALKGFKHYPPAPAADGKFSPCNNRLFAGTKSNQNLTFVTGYFASRYVAKYSAKIDESNRVFIGAGQQHHNSLSFDVQFLHNTKITGCKIQEQKRIAKRHDSRHPTGRAISIMEMMQVTLGYDMVYTNIVFEHLPTKPLGERPGIAVKPRAKEVGNNRSRRTPQDLSSEEYIASYIYRNKENAHLMAEWQKLAPSETIILRDAALSNVTIDKMTVFGVRPPELRFVRQPAMYFKWFYRSIQPILGDNLQQQLTTVREKLHWNIRQSAWIDGLGHQIHVRPKALSFIISYMEQMNDDSDFYCSDHNLPITFGTIARDSMIGIFEEILTSITDNDDNDEYHPDALFPSPMVGRFVGDCGRKDASREKRELPIIWFDPIPPTQGHRFIIHLLLSMGKFDNEMNLLTHRTMRECFEYAKLVPVGIQEDCQLEGHCKLLLKGYILDQLVFQPCGTKQFDRFVVAAWQTIKEALMRNELPFRELPSYLYTQLSRAITDSESRLQKTTRRELAETVMDNLDKKGINMLRYFDIESLIRATPGRPIPFAYDMVQGDGQPELSFIEQKETFGLGKERFQKYKATTTSTTKGLIINGGPGTGKTTLMELMIVYAYCAGLFSVLTAVMSERASQLGGIHISQLMCIPVRKGVSCGRLAEMAYLDLLKAPDKLALLRQMDVLFIDEFGQVSAELLATMDMIMRRVRNSSQFMGGLLVIGTYDYLQLPPVEGRPPLLSPHILTSFILRKLEHSVRAGKDKILQQIQEYTRLSPARFADVRENFIALVVNNCTFVSSFDNDAIPTSTLRMFGKKKAATLAITNLLAQMRRKHGSVMTRSDATDLEASVEGVFVQATQATSRRLNTQVKEPSTLFFYPGALYEITFNKKNHYNQAQLAVLRNVPDEAHIAEKRPVEIMLAPPGCKSLPHDYTTPDELSTNGWKPATVGLCAERIHNFQNGLQAKRLQYGLRPRIASTIHSGMGQDLPGIVTRVTSEEEDMDYNLWSKEQVIVLLSRTHFAKDIIFVGDGRKTAKALADCLSHVSQYTDYMAHIMDSLTGPATSFQNSFIDPYLYNPFRMADYQIPNTVGSFCYNLVSLGDPTCSTSYIGETSNLAHRFALHNQRNGAVTTQDISLIPWALLGFVAGFEGDTAWERKSFETAWQAARNARETALRRKLRPDEIGAVAVSLISRNRSYHHLRYVRCGKLCS